MEVLSQTDRQFQIANVTNSDVRKCRRPALEVHTTTTINVSKPFLNTLHDSLWLFHSSVLDVLSGIIDTMCLEQELLDNLLKNGDLG